MERPPFIRLIENEENDMFFFRRALSRLNFNGTVRLVDSVTEGFDYLKGERHFGPKLLPPSRPHSFRHEPARHDRQRLSGMADVMFLRVQCLLKYLPPKKSGTEPQSGEQNNSASVTGA